MSVKIRDVTMTRPSDDITIEAGHSFVMGGQIVTHGGGPFWKESGDMYFEWDQGNGAWVPIDTSGDLYHVTDNPVAGLQTSEEQTIDIYSDAMADGTYQLRVKIVEDDGTTEHISTVHTVTVTSRAQLELHDCVHMHLGQNITLAQARAVNALPAYGHDLHPVRGRKRSRRA